MNRQLPAAFVENPGLPSKWDAVRPPLRRYGAAVLGVAVATWFRLLLDPQLGLEYPFGTLFFCVVWAAWYGGRGPALAAVVFGAISADVFLLPPRGSLYVAGRELTGLMLFVGVGIGVALLGGAMSSARRKAEASAAEARQTAALIEQAYDPVLVWDWDGPIRVWNRGAERLYGYSKAEALGRISHELLHTSVPGGVAAFVGHMQAEGSWEGELEHTTRDGQRIVVESRMTLVREAGRAYVIEANRDISARRRAEALGQVNEQLASRVSARTAELAETYESLRLSEARFGLLIGGVKDYALFMLDTAGQVISWNEGAEIIMGYAADEIIGRNFSSFYTIGDASRGQPMRDLKTTLDEGRHEEECLRQRKSGAQFWAMVTITSLRDGDGRHIGFAHVTRDITERKRTERIKSDRANQLRRFVEQAPAAIAMFDREMRYIAVSERWLESFGLSGQSLPGRSHYEVFADLPSQWRDVHRRCLAGAVERVEEDAWTRADGSVQWVRWEARPWHSAPETIGGISIYSEDITARKQAEAALRASDARYRQVVDLSAECIWIECEGCIAFANRQTATTFGADRPKDLIGRRSMEFVHPDDRPRVEEGIRTVIDQREAIPVSEVRFLDRSGRPVPLEVQAIPFDLEGRPALLAVARDVTERRRLEARIRAILDCTVDGMICIDQDGIVATISGPAERIFGHVQGDVVGRNVAMLMPEAYKSHFSDHIADYFRTGDAKTLGMSRKVEGLRADGSVFPMDLAIGELPSQGEGREFVGTVRDLTDQRRLEEQLRQSLKMEAVGQLTGGIAHDFNNILTVIIGTAEILLRDLAPFPKLAETAKVIDEAATRGSDLTQRLLAFARKQPLQPRATNINSLILDTSKLLRATLGEQIEIKSMLRDDLPSAFIDRSQLATALINLALNARDAMPHGGKLIIETKQVYLDQSYADRHQEVRPSHYVMIAVSDTGTGIPVEFVNKVFEPFFTTKATGRGTGLGLSMVYGFVKQSGGHVEIYSEQGQGTTIKLYLPRLEGASSAIEDNPTTPVVGGSETILIVEDDPMVRSFVVAQVKALGYKVLSASNGAEALAVIDKGVPFDLLFTDVIMPGAMNGRQLASEASRRRPSIKLLYTSGYAENAIVHHGRLDSGILLLAKPYRQSDLARMIRAAIGQDARQV